MELNPSAVEIVKLLDGLHSPEQVANEIAKNNEISLISITQVVQNVLELCKELERTRVLDLQPEPQESVE